MEQLHAKTRADVQGKKQAAEPGLLVECVGTCAKLRCVCLPYDDGSTILQNIDEGIIGFCNVVFVDSAALRSA